MAALGKDAGDGVSGGGGFAGADVESDGGDGSALGDVLEADSAGGRRAADLGDDGGGEDDGARGIDAGGADGVVDEDQAGACDLRRGPGGDEGVGVDDAEAGGEVVTGGSREADFAIDAAGAGGKAGELGCALGDVREYPGLAVSV